MIDGKVICFEGVNGSGKGEIIHALEVKLQEHGYSTVRLKESSFSEYQKNKNLIRMDKIIGWENRVKRTANARKKVHDVHITPIKNQSNFVLLDRSFYTSAVFQSNNIDEVDKILDYYFTIKMPIPIRTYVLHSPTSVLLSRISHRARKGLESQTKKYLQENQQKYLYICRKLPECVLIDSNRDITEIVDEIYKDILTLS